MTMIQQPDPIGKKALFGDRRQAAQLLAGLLEPFRDTDAVVLAVPRGGVPVGNVIARQLNLPMEVLSCRKITHPGDRSQSIGSVSLQDVVIHDSDRDIPQEYIQYNISRLRASLRREARKYNRDKAVSNLHGKTLIVVDDWLGTGDTVLAGLKGLRRQKPAQIIVGAPIVTTKAYKAISGQADEVVFVVLDDAARPPSHKYFPPVSDEEVLRLVNLRENVETAAKDT